MTPTSQVDIATLYRRHVALVRGCALRKVLAEAAFGLELRALGEEV